MGVGGRGGSGWGTWEGGGWGREVRAHVVDELLLQSPDVGLEDLVLLCYGRGLSAALLSVACADGIEMPVTATWCKHTASVLSSDRIICLYDHNLVY